MRAAHELTAPSTGGPIGTVSDPCWSSAFCRVPRIFAGSLKMKRALSVLKIAWKVFVVALIVGLGLLWVLKSHPDFFSSGRKPAPSYHHTFEGAQEK